MKEFAIVLLMTMCFGLFTWVVKSVVYDNRDGPCVLTKPIGVVKSGIVSLKGMSIFTSGSVMYTLYYPGTYKYSDKECLVGINVTEVEYNRCMYKH